MELLDKQLTGFERLGKACNDGPKYLKVEKEVVINEEVQIKTIEKVGQETSTNSGIP